VALSILQEQNKAEDVLQEVFLKIWRNAAQFDKQRGSLRGWMIRICRNMCIDHLRAKRTPESHSVALDETYALQSHRITTDDPVEKVNHQEMHTVVSKALEKLPAEQSLLIKMAYFQGFSQSEIAKKLNLPLGTIKTRMRLAMKKLRESLITNPDYKGFTK
jgi:RNA polymerase sigma-70 factor (ECF subfamily)